MDYREAIVAGIKASRDKELARSQCVDILREVSDAMLELTGGTVWLLAGSIGDRVEIEARRGTSGYVLATIDFTLSGYPFGGTIRNGPSREIGNSDEFRQFVSDMLATPEVGQYVMSLAGNDLRIEDAT